MAPGICLLYATATWAAPRRTLMVAVAVGMLAAAAASAWLTERPGRAWRLRVVRATDALLHVAGCATLSLLDGGVASPLGALVPFAVLAFAVGTPPLDFLHVAGVSVVGYGAIAVLGGPSPPGYPQIYVLTIGGIAWLCLRHTAVLASLNRRLNEVSRRDSLTGCLNRRGLDDRLAQELAEADRTGRPVTLVIADLNRFKEINDTYGHQAGDRLLGWTSRALGRQARGQDRVGRLGGDEFAVILPGTGPETAQTVMDGIRDALDGVTAASLGHATYPTEVSSMEELKRLADERVYRDKLARRPGLISADRIATALCEDGHRPAATVSRQERRRRSIADMGLIAASEGAVGVVYAVGFAEGTGLRLTIGLLGGLGGLYGLLGVPLSGRLSRYPGIRWLLLVCTIPVLAIAATIPVLCGGISSTAGVALLVPIPMIALGAPPRMSLPVCTVTAAAYVTIGLVMDRPGWYLGTHLAGALAVAALCAAQGRAAAHQRRRLAALSRLDPLTGCLNRYGFDECFANELGRLEPASRAVGLLIIDLDGFKQINDAQGHAAGDEVLRWVADTLRTHVRSEDAVGRLGGDEFVVLLVAESAEGLLTAAQRLPAVLAQRVPASVGYAMLGRDGADFDSLYAHADAELYVHKRQRGRGTGAGRAEPVPGATGDHVVAPGQSVLV